MEKLRGIDALVSVLNMPGYKQHYALLDAAIKAGQCFAASLFDARHPHRMVADPCRPGVKQFYPSECGFYHLYHASGELCSRVIPERDAPPGHDNDNGHHAGNYGTRRDASTCISS